ncbi:hypothetical protein RchiOBHm_Chr7g0236471 [Rosa chinensis]|uniref:Uncharacterized protein n=1 Tax=Rosa chinensis TaxID=74649 RepID=A0A2P6PGX9_ROSCH|nr:hypothetical protein RchiOBHm_Chr7g0236471 [Rosa chinensis]
MPGTSMAAAGIGLLLKESKKEEILLFEIGSSIGIPNDPGFGLTVQIKLRKYQGRCRRVRIVLEVEVVPNQFFISRVESETHRKTTIHNPKFLSGFELGFSGLEFGDSGLEKQRIEAEKNRERRGFSGLEFGDSGLEKQRIEAEKNRERREIAIVNCERVKSGIL